MATQTQSAAGEGPEGGTVYRSAATAVVLAGSLRLIGLVSVFVLARLLSPSDFGIIALATATMALVDIFSALGLRQALLRIQRPERAHLDTAWTIQLILMTTLAAALAALAPAAAAFFEEPALAWVIVVLSLRFVCYGVANIGIVDFDRHLQFGRDLQMRVSVRVAALLGTVAAAVLLRSYWALAIGLVLQSALHAAASYAFHPYRPRLSLARRSELLNVSLWMFLAYAAQVVQNQAERLAVGRFAAIHSVGLYSVSKDLSSIFTLEIATALNRVTFVTTARRARPLHEEPDRAVAMLGAYAMIAAPLGLGLAAIAEDAILVLFGAPWGPAAPVLQLIAPASACYAVYKLIASSLQASGLARRAAVLSCSGAAVTAAAAFAAGVADGDGTSIAAAVLAANAAVLGGGILAFAQVARTSPWRLAAAVARPFAASAVMLVLVRAIIPDTGVVLADLAASISAGATVYSSALLLAWAAAGKPVGAEANALAAARRLVRVRRWSRG